MSSKHTRPTKTPIGRPFNVLLSGTALANTADGILITALPLIAIQFTRSPQLISAISAAAWLPWLLFGAVAGVIIDRLDRRKLQLLAMGVRAALLSALTLAAFQGWINVYVLIAFMLAYGITEVFADLASAAMVPAVVPTGRLGAANSRMQAVQHVCNTFLGAPIAAGLLALGAAWALATPAALCIAFLAVLGLGLRGSYRAPRAATPSPAIPSPATPSISRELNEGWQAIRHHPILRPLIITSSLFNFASTAYFSVFVLWAVGSESKMGLSQESFALILMSLPTGAVLGSLITERLSDRFEPVYLMTTSWTVNGALLIVPVLLPNAAALIGTCFALGLSNTVGNVIGRTLRQQMVPERALGRVGGMASTLSYGSMPLGAITAGVVAAHFGLATLFVAVSCFLVGVGFWVAARIRPDAVASVIGQQNKLFAQVG